MRGVEFWTSQQRVLTPVFTSMVTMKLCHVTSDGATSSNQLRNKIRKFAQTLRLRAQIPETATAVATTALNVLFPEPEKNLRNPGI